MRNPDPQPVGMSPLQRLILDRMRERGWSPRDVEARGIKHATLHRYMNPLVMRSLPRESVMRDLSEALGLPLDEVKRAAWASLTSPDAAHVLELSARNPARPQPEAEVPMDEQLQRQVRELQQRVAELERRVRE